MIGEVSVFTAEIFTTLSSSSIKGSNFTVGVSRKYLLMLMLVCILLACTPKSMHDGEC